MSKRGYSTRGGPKYQRYFHAYSDKMLVDGAMSAMANISLDVNEVAKDFDRPNELVRIELPITTLDLGTRHGIMLIPEQKKHDTRQWCAPYTSASIGPRDAAAATDLSLLFPPWFPPGELYKDICLGFGKKCTIAYREPTDTDMLEKRLLAHGLTILENRTYKRLGKQGEEKVVIYHIPMFTDAVDVSCEEAGRSTFLNP